MGLAHWKEKQPIYSIWNAINLFISFRTFTYPSTEFDEIAALIVGYNGNKPHFSTRQSSQTLLTAFYQLHQFCVFFLFICTPLVCVLHISNAIQWICKTHMCTCVCNVRRKTAHFTLALTIPWAFLACFNFNQIVGLFFAPFRHIHLICGAFLHIENCIR